MNLESDVILVGGISLGTAISLVVYIVKASAEYGALKAKVDTMWAFQMRRAISEVSEKGLGTLNSPLVFTESAIRALAPIKDALIRFYNNIPYKDDDAAALLEIEKKFGNALLEVVCIPCGLSHGACLILALAVAKQSSQLSINI